MTDNTTERWDAAASGEAGLAATVEATATPPLPTPPLHRLVEKYRVWGVLLFMGVAWGLSISLAKIAALSGAHPFGITFWQSFLSAGVLVVFNAVQRRRISLNRRMLGLYVVCGLLGSVIPGILYFYAASRISAGVLSITIALVPILTYVAAVSVGIEKIVRGRVTGVACGAVAVVLLVAPEGSLPDPSDAVWVLAALVAAVCYVGENMVLALRMPEGAHPLMVTCGMFLAATAIMAPVVLATDTFVPLGWPWGRLEWSIVGMVMVSSIAYTLFVYLVKTAGPVFASQTAYVITLSGVAWGMVIFDERHSMWIWISLALMLAGLILVTPRKKSRT